MSKIKLTTYLNKIEAKYINAREDWEKLQKELKNEEERYQNIKWINFSFEGRKEEQNRHTEKKNEIFEGMEKIRKDFEKGVGEVIEHSDKVFNRVYQYTSEDVDMKGVAILQNSSMSDKELLNLAESYRSKGNYTMYFMVAEKLKKDKPFEMLDESEREAQAYWGLANERRSHREDHDCLESFGEVCLKALRNEDYLSNGIHKEHENFYRDFLECAEGIETEMSSPWEE